MDEKQAAATLKAAGDSIHFHDGIWWKTVSRGFCKPVDLLRPFAPGEVRPSSTRAWLGYSHIASNPKVANHVWDVLFLEGEKLDGFELLKIKPKRRRQIKYALDELQFGIIKDVHPHLEAMNEINVSTAQRTGHGKPASYYVEHRSEWERFMTREFSLPGREWWGAFREERLIAYYYTHIIGGTMFINAAKSHTDFLKFGPNDGLVYTLLEHHARAGDCTGVVYGDWSHDVPSLNEFKQRYGFERKLFPIFRSNGIPMRLALWWKQRQGMEAMAKPALHAPSSTAGEN